MLTHVRQALIRFHQTLICDSTIHTSPNAPCLISIVSTQLSPMLKQKLMRVHRSKLPVLFSDEKIRRKQHIVDKLIYSAHDLRRPVGKSGIQRVLEGLLFKIIPRRDRLNVLARSSDIFGTDPVKYARYFHHISNGNRY